MRVLLCDGRREDEQHAELRLHISLLPLVLMDQVHGLQRANEDAAFILRQEVQAEGPMDALNGKRTSHST